jgi:hypothetical protein
VPFEEVYLRQSSFARRRDLRASYCKSGILTWKIVGQDRSMFYAEDKRAQGNRKLNNYRKCFGVRDLEFGIGVMTKIT